MISKLRFWAIQVQFALIWFDYPSDEEMFHLRVDDWNSLTYPPLDQSLSPKSLGEKWLELWKLGHFI